MSGKAVRETLAALGVIASLVFVGAEIRQNTAVARSQARQALADASMEAMNTVSGDPQLYEDYRDWLNATDEEVLDCQQTRMCAWIIGLARHHENVFFQAQEGLVSEEVFASYGFNDSNLYQSPFFSQFWPRLKLVFHPGFAAVLEAEYDLAP